MNLLQKIAENLGATGATGASWIQALADHYGVTGGDGDWLIGIEQNT